MTAVERRIGWDESLARALEYAETAEPGGKSQPSSIDVARRAVEMGSDRDTVIAALLSDPGLRGRLDDARIEQEFGGRIAQLTRGLDQLNAMKEGGQARFDSPEQAEKLRRLLMVADQLELPPG